MSEHSKQQMSHDPIRILLIDDKEKDRELASFILEQELDGVSIIPVDGAMEFVEAVTSGDISVVIAECQLAWTDGTQIFKTLQRLYPLVPVIFFSDAPTPNHDIKPRHDIRDARLKKDSSGFLALPHVVKRLVQAARDTPAIRLVKPNPAAPLQNDGIIPQSDPISISTADAAEQQNQSTFTANHAADLIERLPVGVIRLSSDGIIEQANATFASLLGFSEADQVIGQDLSELLSDQSSQQVVRDTFARGGDLGLELKFRGPDGKDVWTRLDLWPVREDSGPIMGFEGSAVDITADKRRTSEISLLNADLERSNEQLEHFAHIAAHDLQEPLGLISRYARLLRDRYSLRLDNDAKRYIEQLLDNTQQLHELVDSILAYSKTHTHDQQPEVVDFGAVVAQAAANLQARFDDTGAQLQHDRLPALRADSHQMVQLFQNLFSNSLKFRGPNTPRISVFAREETAHWLFAVQDNGIGIAPKDQERLFTMLERLHTTDDYPGRGMGLAISRSIVERHGGRLWVESVPGSGSIFYFTLPKQS